MIILSRRPARFGTLKSLKNASNVMTLVYSAMNVLHRSIFFSAVERYGSLFFFLVSTGFLARLLTPAEFGIYALINALTAVAAASFQEFGGANYLIQKHSLSEQNIRTAFTVTFCLSALFAVVLFEFRDAAAWFFSEEGLKIGIAVSALNFILSPFLMTISALLRRDMAFGVLARCSLIGTFVTAVLSVVLAFLGYSFMAPILGTLVGNAVVVALLIARWGDLRVFLPSLGGYRDVIGFGAYSTSTVIINVFYNMAPQFILARSPGLHGRGSVWARHQCDASIREVRHTSPKPRNNAGNFCPDQDGRRPEADLSQLDRVTIRTAVAISDYVRNSGGPNHFALVWSDLDRNRPLNSDALPCLTLAICGVPDLPGSGRCRPCS